MDKLFYEISKLHEFIANLARYSELFQTVLLFFCLKPFTHEIKTAYSQLGINSWVLSKLDFGMCNIIIILIFFYINRMKLYTL